MLLLVVSKVWSVVAAVGLQFAQRKGNAPKSCPEPHTLFNPLAKGGTSLITTFEVAGHSKTAFEWEKGRKFPKSNVFFLSTSLANL